MGRRILVLLIGLALICGLVGCDQEPRMITVTFDANGATGDVPPSITVSCYDEIVVPTQGSLHKDGYYFTGWSSSRDNYAYYKSGDKKQFMHDELLYACWEEGCSDNVFGYSDETKTEIVYLCDRTATYYSIPYGVVKIGSRVFEGCSGISSIQIPDSVTEIEWNAFKGCTGLSELVLPSSIKKIGSDAFSSCNSLQIVFEEGITSIPDYALDCSYDDNGITSVKIPSTVVGIGTSAFSGCCGLTSITIPAGVTYIGDSAFYGCTGLTSITIPDSVTFIDDSAFGSCTGLASITIPEGVTGIGYRTFSYCSNLKRITIPKTITNIESWVFDECYNLVDIQYNSTIEDWNSISKDWDWDYGTPSFTIHCTDGDISK